MNSLHVETKLAWLLYGSDVSIIWGLGSHAVAWQTHPGVVSNLGLGKDTADGGELAVAPRVTHLTVPGPVRPVGPCENMFLTIQLRITMHMEFLASFFL